MAKPGSRIELIYTSDEFTDLTPGDRGTVLRSNPRGIVPATIDVVWDSGSTLSLIDGEDRWKVVGT